MPEYTSLTPEIIQEVREKLGSGCLIEDPEKIRDFEKDASDLHHGAELVIEATSVEQIAELLRLANKYRFPVTPRGLGTGVAGGAVPLFGGVVLSLAKMNRIISIERENLTATVEPGLLNLDLKNAVQKEGLFYPPDPASLDTCSIGGNAATNAGGPSCVKYGTTKDYVLGIEAVLPSGKKINAGVQTRKGVVGYDLLHLIVGSEGTLGVITKLILKLIPNPPAITTMVALFSRLTSAMEGVTNILVRGHIPCAIEYLDRRCLDLVGDLLPYGEKKETGVFLLVEADGAPDVIGREIEEMGTICMESGALNVIMAPDSIKRSRMWEIRREVALRVEDHSPVYIPEDVVVPIGKIAEFVACFPEFERDFAMKIFSFGHAGDGNIHLNITAESEKERQKVEEGVRLLLHKVIAMGGTISGEHGIGIAKKPFLSMELSGESIRLQKEIKRIFDPLSILNPGKIFDLD
ncbi:MAG: FAD-binding protein [Deltaproteobacteria bacterium]|nr:FAD-binding protein [Deltaproteobacteria bacterium]MBN2845521.1 FAD-binding protein [Deltaproteobacteria bacterium]